MCFSLIAYKSSHSDAAKLPISLGRATYFNLYELSCYMCETEKSFFSVQYPSLPKSEGFQLGNLKFLARIENSVENLQIVISNKTTLGTLIVSLFNKVKVNYISFYNSIKEDSEASAPLSFFLVCGVCMEHAQCCFKKKKP